MLDLPAGHARGHGELLPVVVASDRSHRFGVVVDRFLGERDLRVSPLDPRLGKVPDINSSSVLENGWPVLIVDVEDLVRSIDNLLSGRRLGKLTAEVVEHKARAPKRVLVVDDSITVRELERQLLENRGYTVDVAVDGVDGWNAVRSGHYDLVVSDVDMPRMDGIQLVAAHQARRAAQGDPGRHRLVQGPRGRPDPGARRRRQRLPDQEQLPRPDVPDHRGRPDRRAAGMTQLYRSRPAVRHSRSRRRGCTGPAFARASHRMPLRAPCVNITLDIS